MRKGLGLIESIRSKGGGSVKKRVSDLGIHHTVTEASRHVPRIMPHLMIRTFPHCMTSPAVHFPSSSMHSIPLHMHSRPLHTRLCIDCARSTL